MVGLIEIPTTPRGKNRGRRPRTDQRVSKSRDRWSRHISARRGASVHRTGSRDPLRYINAANTYQFVGSDPVEIVDPEGLFHKMSGEDMDRLAHAVENNLWADGAVGVRDGWTRLGAATGGGPSVKKIVKGGGKHALEQQLANRRVQPVDQHETEVWYWTGKVRNEATG